MAVLTVAIAAASGVAAGSNQSTELATENGTVNLEAAPGQFVTGDTVLRAGSVVTIRLDLRLGEESFTATERAVVDQYGTFRAPFNLSAVPSGTTVRLVVTHDELELAAVNGTVRECTTACETSDPETVEAEFVTIGETLQLEAGPGRVVRIDSTLPAGTTVSLRMQSASDASTRFLQSTTAVVNANGTARATFNLADEQYVGSRFTLSALHDGEEVARIDGTIVTCTEACTPPEPAPPTAPTIGETVADNAVVHADEPLVIPLELNGADGAVVQLKGYGDSESFRLDATVRDGSGDGRVVVVFDPGAPAEGAVLFGADQGDEITIQNRSNRPRPGRYALRVGDAAYYANRTGDIDVSDFRTFTVESVTTTSPSAAATTTPETSSTSVALEMVALFVAGFLAVAGVSLLTGTIQIRW